MFFDQYTEFVECDVRKNRELFKVTSESLTKRCESILTPDCVYGKTILDLGSALGAMGHYAMNNGCSFYTGVEIQKTYREKSEELLSRYNPGSDYKLLHTIDDATETSDTVLACGYIHGFFDVFGLLQKICSLSNQFVIIETHKLSDNAFPMIVINSDGNMVMNNGYYTTFKGIQSSPNKHALDIIMGVNGFILDKEIKPKPILNSHDPYDDTQQNSRIICRYRKSIAKLSTLESNINEMAIR